MCQIGTYQGMGGRSHCDLCQQGRFAAQEESRRLQESAFPRFALTTLRTDSQKCSASSPSRRTPASSAITPASLELCDTAVCLLHSQVSGTKCAQASWYFVKRVVR